MAPRDLARLLIEREATRSNGPDAATAAAHAACEHLYARLARWVGAEGTRALFRRALSDAKRRDPELAAIEVQDTGEGRVFQGVPAAVSTHGDAKVAPALEVMLTELLDLLARFIGADLVVTLADPGRADLSSSPVEE